MSSGALRLGNFGFGVPAESGCRSVFVDESCAGGAALDRVAKFDDRGFSVGGGCSLAQAAVGPVLDGFVDQPIELALIPDQGADEQLMAHGADPSLGEGVGSRSAR